MQYLFLFCAAHLAWCAAFSHAPTAFLTKNVPIIEGKDFHPDIHYYHAHNRNQSVIPNDYYETPILIENALSQERCEWICDSLIQFAGEETVVLQHKCAPGPPADKETNLYECTLDQAFEKMMESKHKSSYFCFCEGLLERLNSESNINESEENGTVDVMLKIKNVLNTCKEYFLGGKEDIEQICNHDLFRYFPDEIKPSDCLILAGEGATSTLHRDPFSWTGTSLCLEGTKIWRFISPPGAMRVSDAPMGDSGVESVDELLDAYRLPSTAWDNNADGESQESILLSAGWQSDYSLYEYRNEDETVVPTAEQFAMMEENDVMAKYSKMNSIASSTENLRPSQELLTPSSESDRIEDITIWTVVQKPGDLLVIPAYWWHQTYALEPSLAFASQRCGLERDTPRVLSHIIDTAFGERDIELGDLPTLNNMDSREKVDDPKNIVAKLLDVLAQA